LPKTDLEAEEVKVIAKTVICKRITAEWTDFDGIIGICFMNSFVVLKSIVRKTGKIL